MAIKPIPYLLACALTRIECEALIAAHGYEPLDPDDLEPRRFLATEDMRSAFAQTKAIAKQFLDGQHCNRLSLTVPRKAQPILSVYKDNQRNDWGRDITFVSELQVIEPGRVNVNPCMLRWASRLDFDTLRLCKPNPVGGHHDWAHPMRIVDVLKPLGYRSLTKQRVCNHSKDDHARNLGCLTTTFEMLDTIIAFEGSACVANDVKHEFACLLDEPYPELAPENFPSLDYRKEVFDNLRFDLMRECHTKREYIERAVHRKVPELANKLPLAIGLAVASVASSFSERDKQRLWERTLAQYRNDPESFAMPGSVTVLWNYKTKMRKFGWSIAYTCESLDTMLVEDTVRMLNAMKRMRALPLDLRSDKSIRHFHDEVVREFNAYQQRAERDKHAPEKSQFDRVCQLLADKLGWQRLVTGGELIDEGRRMHNCIGSYIDPMMRDQAALLAIDYEGARHDMELMVSVGNKIEIRQIYAACNKPANSELEIKTNIILTEYNESH